MPVRQIGEKVRREEAQAVVPREWDAASKLGGFRWDLVAAGTAYSETLIEAKRRGTVAIIKAILKERTQ